MTRKPLLPPGYARRLGYKDAMKENPVLYFKDGQSAFCGQPYAIGAVIEVYDPIPWLPFRVPTFRYRHWREECYYKGYAQAIGAILGTQVHLVFVNGRGNGHNDFRIVQGMRPKPPRNGTPYQRRIERVRKLQKSRKALWWYDQFVLMESFLPKNSPWSIVLACRKKLRSVSDFSRRRYLSGWSAKRVAREYGAELINNKSDNGNAA